jgi:hypothetical protein
MAIYTSASPHSGQLVTFLPFVTSAPLHSGQIVTFLPSFIDIYYNLFSIAVLLFISIRRTDFIGQMESHHQQAKPAGRPRRYTEAEARLRKNKSNAASMRRKRANISRGLAHTTLGPGSNTAVEELQSNAQALPTTSLTRPTPSLRSSQPRIPYHSPCTLLSDTLPVISNLLRAYLDVSAPSNPSPPGPDSNLDQLTPLLCNLQLVHSPSHIPHPIRVNPHGSTRQLVALIPRILRGNSLSIAVLVILVMIIY